MIKILNLKLVIFLEYQNMKIFFLQGYVPSSSEEGSVIRKVKSTVPWAYVISNRNAEEMFGSLNKKELQKINQS